MARQVSYQKYRYQNQMNFSLKVTHQNRNCNQVNNTHSSKQSQKNSKENYTKTEEKLKNPQQH